MALLIPLAGLALILLSAGCGSRNESKTAPNQTPGLMRTEVTIRDYAACVSAGACSEPKTNWKTCNWSDRTNRLDHPVNCADWNQADAYCKWAGSRLPTEVEWLAAVKDVNESTDICAKRDNSGTCAAGSYPKDSNPAGVLDLLGNVKEWTETKEMLPGNVEARVIRGAGWQIDPMAPTPDSGRANRETLSPAEFAADLGFRCMSKSR